MYCLSIANLGMRVGFNRVLTRIMYDIVTAKGASNY